MDEIITSTPTINEEPKEMCGPPNMPFVYNSDDWVEVQI